MTVLLAISTARADDRATAQQLFADGKALMAAGKLAEACAKFAAAAELTQTAGVRLNLGACYAKLGRTASAWAAFDDALTLAERNGDTAAASIAHDGESALAPHLSFLTVSIAPEAQALADLEVTRDGQRMPKAAWGVAVPVDPGDHEIVAKASGHNTWTGKSTVKEGQKVEALVPALGVELALPPPPAATPAGAPAEETPPSHSLFSGPGGTQRTIAVVAGGAGIAAIGVGALFGIEMLANKQTNLDGTGYCQGSNCAAASKTAVSDGNIATIGWIAGGVLVAAGATLWLTAPTSKSTTAAFVPLAGPNLGGAAIEGRF